MKWPWIFLAVTCSACVYLGFPGDGAFVVTGDIENSKQCTLKVGLADGTWAQVPRSVQGHFREDYVVDPKSKRYVAAVWCNGEKAQWKEFEYKSGHGIMVVELGTK